MPADEHVTVPQTLRQRRRAAATREILDAAEQHIAQSGPAALSLRAVARGLGMTVQALYHYFPSREALVTELIAKAYGDLADAVQAAVDTAPDDTASDDTAPSGTAPDEPGLPRLVIAAEGYRRWAVAHPERFQLLYGTPLRDYAAPVEGPTTQAMRRMSSIFEREMFDGFTVAQLAAAETPALSPELRAYLEQLPHYGPGRLPPPATALLLSAWGHLNGLVILEVFGHASFLGGHQAEIFRMAMRNLLDDVHRQIPASASAGTGAGPSG
ncbi:TetR/AcrR family transcriptional regulator [Streptomyces sp. NPDC048445]|uniref:TetR/AcrR family transcriptional regulator n=1 Tax=Streptomyces sp. NPDC048445 TaxID=3365553 RepID=UPI003718BC27